MENKIAEIKLSYTPKKYNSKRKITDSQEAYKAFLLCWDLKTIELYEEFKLMLLNNSNQVLGVYTVSVGGYNSTVTDLRLIFSVVLKSGAVSFITAHNHPSGKLEPSKADILIYKKIQKIAEFHDLNYLDNLIITKKNKYSFADEVV